MYLSRQNTCLSQQKYACSDKIMFVATKVLSRQAYVCHDKRLVLSRETRVCCDKRMLVATKLLLSQNYVFGDKYFSLQTFCRDRIYFFATIFSQQNLFDDKHTFVATKDVFCVCHDKTFVATKMILVAAPTNDRQHRFQRTEVGAACFVCVGMDIIFP